MWEDDNEGFVACFLIKKGKLACNLAQLFVKKDFLYDCLVVVGSEDGSKTGHGRRGNLQEGAWDAIHVIEVIVFYFIFVKRIFVTSE